VAGEKAGSLTSQFAMLNEGRAGRTMLQVFTGHGVAMLLSILNNDRALLMNILIIPALIQMRDRLATDRNLAAGEALKSRSQIATSNSALPYLFIAAR